MKQPCFWLAPPLFPAYCHYVVRSESSRPHVSPCPVSERDWVLFSPERRVWSILLWLLSPCNVLLSALVTIAPRSWSLRSEDPGPDIKIRHGPTSQARAELNFLFLFPPQSHRHQNNQNPGTQYTMQTILGVAYPVVIFVSHLPRMSMSRHRGR